MEVEMNDGTIERWRDGEIIFTETSVNLGASPLAKV